MAQRKKTVRSSSRSRSTTKKGRAPIVSPATLRSVVAVVLLAAGAITLIALFLPGGGLLNGYVDGVSVGEVGDIVLRDRRALAKDGMFLVVVTVDKQNGTLVGDPEVVTRGFVASADEKLLRGAADRIAASIATPGEHLSEIGLLKAQIKDGLSNYLYEQTRRRPLVFPVIVEV